MEVIDMADQHDYANQSDAGSEQDPIQKRMDELLHQAIQKALALLGEHGEFYPFGVTRAEDGAFGLTQARLEEENPTSEQVTTKLIQGLARDASQGRYTSAAIVTDVRLRRPETGLFMDAIRVTLEDREQSPMDFFLPYQRDASGKIATDNILAQEARPLIFTA